MVSDNGQEEKGEVDDEVEMVAENEVKDEGKFQKVSVKLSKSQKKCVKSLRVCIGNTRALARCIEEYKPHKKILEKEIAFAKNEIDELHRRCARRALTRYHLQKTKTDINKISLYMETMQKELHKI